MIYLDNAATTFPKPKTVQKSVMEAVTIYGGNPGRSGHALSLRTSEKIYAVRESLANFFGVDSPQVIFTSNCSQSLNMAIKGVMSNGGHAITTVYEHNSVIRPLYALQQKGIISYDLLQISSPDPQSIIDQLKTLVRPETKAVIMTHASNVTGLIMPIKSIGEFCKQHHITFIVDGAQTAGVIPVDLQEMNIDIFCVAGHKGLYGVPGSGLMIMGSQMMLDTIIEGGTGSLSEKIEQPDFLPDRFESGTLNTLGVLSMGAGVEQVKKTGIQRIYQHEFELCEYIYNQIKKIKNIKTYVNFYEFGRYVPVVLFNIKERKWSNVVTDMSHYGYALRGGFHCAFLAHQTIGTIQIGAVRVSPSIFTTKSQIISFVKQLKDYAQ